MIRWSPPPPAPHRGRPERTPRPERTAPVEPVRSAEPVEQIGASGERLTRDEAYDLVRRAVAALTSGDETVRAGVVRTKARELLGRDSESLSDRNFPRILKDAHDGDVIDLRRRGDDFEIARATEAESVAEQLAKTAASNAPVVAASAPAPRGMGPRGGVGRGGKQSGRPGTPPADLLLFGVVGAAGTPAPAPRVTAPSLAAPVSAPPATPAAESAPAPASRGGRKTAAKKGAPATDVAAPPAAKAARKTVAKKSATTKTPAAKKPRAKKTVARSDA